MRRNSAVSSEGQRLRLTFAGMALTALCSAALTGCNDKPTPNVAPPPTAGGPTTS
ncbi:MAG: hypothetical protein JWN14_3078, partial [Chthonomonadales bacterium]|nr:hypothetical protein [Chthonomonadales bacterium]